MHTVAKAATVHMRGAFFYVFNNNGEQLLHFSKEAEMLTGIQPDFMF